MLERNNKMSQTITFFPLGNAETILLELSNGKNLLFDYADTHTNDLSDKRINLADELKDKELFDVVMFSHAHDDHVCGAKDFFEFDHAQKYQGDGRAVVKELWVSSAFILDKELDSEDARVIRQEARHRLKNKNGILVFAEPDELGVWLESNGMSSDDVDGLIIHAGTILDNSLHSLGDEVQFFVHAPFSEDAEGVTDRNEPSIVMQVRLKNQSRETNILITGDTSHSVLEKIVIRSEDNNNSEYLSWDMYDIPHHCSYLSLSDEKGDKMTTPTDVIIRLLLDYSQPNSVMVASCKPVSENSANDQPPHIEAKKAYEHFSGNKKFLATMEYPTKQNPKPLRYCIDSFGIQEKLPRSASILASPAPRAGNMDE